MTIAEFKKIFNPKEWEFVYQERNEQRYMMADFWARSLHQQHVKQLNLKSESEDVLFFSDSNSYARKSKRQNVLNAVREAVNVSETYLNYVHDTTLERVQEFESFANDVAANITEYSNRETLAEIWLMHDDILLTTIPWFYIPWYITEGNMISDRVQEGIERHRSEIERITELWNAVQIVITPTKHMMYQDEQRDFIELVKSYANDKTFLSSRKFNRLADEYLVRHAWLKTYFMLPIEPLTHNELVARIRDACQQGLLSDFREQNIKRQDRRKLGGMILDTLHNDDQLVADIQWAQEYGWLLTWSVEVALHAAANLQPFYKRVSEEIGVTFDDFSHLTSAEILGCLRGESEVPSEKVKLRKEAYVFLYDNGVAMAVVGQQAKSIMKWVTDGINQISHDITELEGQAASPGRARGPVRLIRYAQNANELQDGEILICSMTSPDYVPAMKRAAAIVTDEGGMLCHAAIVSRELGIPCIVGTRIATRVLNDGDEVEVDADAGVVRKLNNK